MIVERPVPFRVARAEALASRLGFAQSCERAVGELLAVLAAGVGTGGRILEIGTGVGYGTAWLVEGVEQGANLELVSIEIDVARHAALTGQQWPPFVRFVLGDVLDEFDQLGAFSLIFADAQGGKWDGLDRTIAALEPGGLLVVDDMHHPTVRIVQDQAERTARVRTTLLSDPRLRTVELDWSSGLILARRRGAD